MRPLLFAVLLAAGPVAAQDYITFQSPSGNIACAMFSFEYNGVRCDIRQVLTQSLSRPANCDLDYGQAFEVQTTGNGFALCHGDTVANPSAPVLGYGQSFSRNGITCTSAQSGMTCQNGAGGGFSIARSGRRVF